ncbi:MAG: M20/M25/M40 family metallo-hydrolase [Opitutales bacterium]|nr:M20/M25/M40 family metallo-hydrolase [Opitutales bacterium]
MFDPIKAIIDFTAHASVSADPEAKGGINGAVGFLKDLFEKEMGLDVKVVETPGHPVVIAKRGGDPAWPHVVVYGHYDVQPADPLEEWHTPPFEALVKGDEMFGRGVADDKGPVMVHIAALARLLERRSDLPLRVTFIVEGEEEIGSVNLAAVMRAHKAELSGDFLLMSDTTGLGRDDESITTGLRGISALEVRLQGPRQDLHSGFHGGAVMNPVRALVALCASLHDADGRVNIPGFYDDVVAPQDWEREEMDRLGRDPEDYRKLLGVPELCPPPDFDVFESRCFGPTLEFNGISGGYQGHGSKTIIPAKASAKISCRLVPNQDSFRILDLLEKTLRERCPKGVTMEIERHHGGDPYLVLPPHKSGEDADTAKGRAFKAADEAIREQFGSAPHYLREGGSVPILSDIRRILGLDALMLSVALQDCNMHSPNEKLDLIVFERCSKVSERILEAVADGV